MIQKIRKSRTFKGTCVFLIFNILAQIVAPLQSLALTGGESQPEFSNFTSIGVSDMVDLASGDMNYNIPLMDVGGYPLNIAYSSGVGNDDEASGVGLGWNLSVGQINNNVRGIPDDFDGDKGDAISYEDHLKKNITVEGSFRITPNIFGEEVDISKLSVGEQNDAGGGMSYGVTASYNNYTGFDLKRSIGFGNNSAVGLEVQSGPDGICLSPEVKFGNKINDKEHKNKDLGASIGVSFNSRQGLSALSLSMDKRTACKSSNKIKSYLNSVTNKPIGSSIGFTDPVYTPTTRSGMVTGSFAINVALGSEFFGGEAQGQISAYGTIQELAETSRNIKAYGYSNTEKADQYSTLDINREKDGPVSKNTTNLPITNYTYDIHSVQGQGISGMYRPYRNQVGFVYDAYASDQSTSANIGLEFGVGNAVHNGWDIGITSVEGHSGLWNQSVIDNFTNVRNTSADYETVHYKNVGDLSVDRDFTSDENSDPNFQLFNRIGGYEATNIPIVGIEFFRSLTNKYSFKGGEIAIDSPIYRSKRQIRNQMITNITNDELVRGIGNGPLRSKPLEGSRLGHHIGEVQITRNDGARYVYGLPAYNKIKKEVTFAVKPTTSNVDFTKGLVDYENIMPNINAKKYKDLPNDQYFNKTTTPGYVHTHLLTSVLSADYQDINDNGVDQEDLGSYTLINYYKNPRMVTETNIEDNSSNIYNWRVPLEAHKAAYNEGLKTELTDDQGNYTFGQKDMFYVKTIVTKTHAAFFKISPRKDAKGVVNEDGGIDNSKVSFKIDKISLYSLADCNYSQGEIAINTGAKAIKEVHFVYNYDLCKNVLNNSGDAVTANSNELSNNGGKLTLKKMYFTYRNSKMGKYTSYDFNYNENDPDQNPNYDLKGYDSWGNYKKNTGDNSNASPITALEFPYTIQDRSLQNKNAAVWTLKEIDLPSGGNIKINYESDDYSSVQDKNPLKMYKVVGASRSGTITSDDINNSLTDVLYEHGVDHQHTNFLIVELPDENRIEPNSTNQINKYLAGLENDLIQFRFFINMTKFGDDVKTIEDINKAKFDYVSGYAELDRSNISSSMIYQNSANNKFYLSIPVKKVEKEGGLIQTNQVDRNPISKAAWQFGRQQLSKHVYSTYDNGDPVLDSPEGVIKDIAEDLFSTRILNNLFEIFAGPNGLLEKKGIGRSFVKEKSFIRLSETTGKKLGGGSRVVSVKMKDVWEKMNEEVPGTLGGYQTMSYGQMYEYMNEDNLTSSGVATYEPIGNKENPFVQPVFSTKSHLLAPDDANYVEKPFGECFFPTPQVTYGRVKVQNIAGGMDQNPLIKVKKQHQTGSVVTEFYTSKDYPTIVDQTNIQGKVDNTGVLGSLLKVFTKKQFTASQGYLISINDMDKKKKSERVYAVGNLAPISGVDYLYDDYEVNGGGIASRPTNSNRGRLNNLVTVIYPNGDIRENTIGVEYDIANDFRENEINSTMGGAQANVAGFFLGIFPGIVPTVLPKFNRNTERLKTVSTTKVINTFGILKETIAYDDGAKVSTRNLAWDAMTGEVLLTQTVDEYDDKYYTLNYPAHWMYQGMAAASLNLGFSGVMTTNKTLLGSEIAENYLISGDEIALKSANGNTIKGWVINVSGDSFDVIDKIGNEITISSDTPFKIIRSGHRNLQSADIMNITLMQNPLINVSTNQKLSSINSEFLLINSQLNNDWSSYRIINAGAVEYSDDWKSVCECFGSNSNLKTHNPYLTNEKGNWRTKSSRTFLTGRNFQTARTGRREGFFTTFTPFYKLNSINQKWQKYYPKWTFVSEVSIFSPVGVELENKDALNRYSAAQYGYNNKFPMAVGANSKYSEIGFDGFEDYDFTKDCIEKSHFSFREAIQSEVTLTDVYSHSGKYSIKINPGKKASLHKKIKCTSTSSSN